MRKNNQTGRILIKCGADKKVNNFLWRTAQMCRYFLTTCTNKVHEDKNIKQMSCYTQETGRSMVEMLGVLAIIGVLSVGAIAGYSKAMFKYKLNKQAQQLNTIINLMSRHTKSFEGMENRTYLLPIFSKINEIPKEMIRPSTNFIYDVFNTEIILNYQDNQGKFLIMFMYPEISKNSTNNLEICKNIILTAKENSSSIRNLQTIGSSNNANDYTFVFGDNYCVANSKCLKNISLDDIYKTCTAHLNKEGTHLKIVWDAL